MRGRGGRFVAHAYADTHTCAHADPYAHANAGQPVPEL
jgi:hypothetical protein